MTRTLFVFLFIATLTIAALGQTQNQPEVRQTCDLSLSQAPVIRGIRLGMKPDEWLKLFPGSDQDEKIKSFLSRPPQYPDYGSITISFASPSDQDSEGFKYLPGEGFLGVNRVRLHLIDNQIAGFGVEYARSSDVDNPWDDISQLITIFSDAFNLPKTPAWEKIGNQQASLRCPGFELHLNTSNSTPSVYLESKPDLKQVIRQRREADKQKHRAAFKP